MDYDTNVFVSNEFFNPETDTIYNRIDSSVYNGILHFKAYNRSGGQENLNMLYEAYLYSVNNGLCKPIYTVSYFQNLKKPQHKIIKGESFFSDTLNKYISYNKNGNPWCFQTYYIDSMGNNISEKIVLDSIGRLMTRTQRKDDYLHGLIQTIISNGDTLALQYETGNLVNVLNKNTLFFSEENKLISENEFIDRDSDWVYYWGYITVKSNTTSKIIFYRYDGNDCEIKAFPEDYCLTGERRRQLIKKMK